jgi:tellurite resistance protein
VSACALRSSWGFRANGAPSILAAMSKKLSLAEHADRIRDELKVPRQSEVFAAAVEAGYLAARADGEVDGEERATLVKAVELLSRGAVIEWETETLVDECRTRAVAEGDQARAEKVGATLRELGHPEPALLVAAFVARATNGVEKSEAEVLKAIGKAAGVSAQAVGGIVKRATDLEE